ncbi:hypothetical protein SAMN05660640_05931, partial [Pseudomonas sp. NFACC16-2]
LTAPVAHGRLNRSPRVIRATFLLMPVGSTSQRSVQVSGFEDIGLLTPLCRLIRFLFVRPAFCLGLSSDSQSPATPLPLANTSPCRVCRGLAPPSHQRGHHSQAGCACAQRAMPGAPIKSPAKCGAFFDSFDPWSRVIFVARGFIPAGLRSSPTHLPGTPSCLVWGRFAAQRG